MDFVERCLKYNPEERITSTDAIKSKVFRQFWFLASIPVEVKLFFETMYQFRPTLHFQMQTLKIMIRRLNPREMAHIKMIYNALDTEKDGEITTTEFKAALRNTFRLELSDWEMRRLLCYIDMNDDGMIQFSEFVIAGCNKFELITDQSLRVAFSNMDVDKNGKISKADYDFTVRGFSDDNFDKSLYGYDWRKMENFIKVSQHDSSDTPINELTF